MLATSLSEKVTLRLKGFLTKLERALKKTDCYLLGTHFKLKILRLRSWNEGKRVCLHNGRLG